MNNLIMKFISRRLSVPSNVTIFCVYAHAVVHTVKLSSPSGTFAHCISIFQGAGFVASISYSMSG
jgi:hypothetical protein